MATCRREFGEERARNVGHWMQPYAVHCGRHDEKRDLATSRISLSLWIGAQMYTHEGEYRQHIVLFYPAGNRAEQHDDEWGCGEEKLKAERYG